MRTIGAAACAGTAAWCSLGTLGLLGASGDTRVALLPPLWLLGTLIVAVWVSVKMLRLTPAQSAPLFGSSVAILPWLPLPLPAAAFLWASPFVLLVWMMVLVGMIEARPRSIRSRWLSDASRASAVAALSAFVLFGASALWLAPILPDGDAPHYLIIAQSLIKDGDLRIENNHRNGDDLEYSLFAAQPDYQQRGRNGAIYSIHAPGLPAIVAPAYFLFGYPGTVALLAAIGALSMGLVWRLGYRTTGSAAAAWFGWASCALTAPFFFQATQVFPDGLGATFVLLGMLPLIESGGWDTDPTPARGSPRWLLAGASLAVLPWLQTRLTILAVTIALCATMRMRSLRQFVTFAAVPAVSAALWFGYFYTVYGTPDPSAPYGDNTQTTIANLARGFPGLLFDQQFGLIANSPVYAFTIVGVIVGSIRNRRWGHEVSVVAAPYLIGVGMFYIWWGGTSAPARLLAPLAMVLGVAAARAWHEASTHASKVLGLAGLGASILMTSVLLGPGRGGLLMNERDGYALWLEWASDLLNLPAGLPSIFRDPPLQAWLKTAAWVACGLVAWLALRAARPGIESRDRLTSGGFSWLATWCLSLAVMGGFTLSWWIGRAQPLTPAASELGLLRGLSGLRPLVIDYRGRVDDSAGVRQHMRVRTERGRRPVVEGALLFATHVPAGTYQAQVALSGPAEGALALRVGGVPFPIWTASLTDAKSHFVGNPIRLPVAVKSILVEGDELARRRVTSVELTLVEAGSDATTGTFRGQAQRAVPYGPVGAYFADDLSYPEPHGFWVAGRRETRVVLSGYGPVRELFLRNVPVANIVTIDVDGTSQQLVLAAREEKTIQLPGASGQPDALLTIRTQAGVRPAQLDPASGDLRYLGCWVEIR